MTYSHIWEYFKTLHWQFYQKTFQDRLSCQAFSNDVKIREWSIFRMTCGSLDSTLSCRSRCRRGESPLCCCQMGRCGGAPLWCCRKTYLEAKSSCALSLTRWWRGSRDVAAEGLSRIVGKTCPYQIAVNSSWSYPNNHWYYAPLVTMWSWSLLPISTFHWHHNATKIIQNIF